MKHIADKFHGPEDMVAAANEVLTNQDIDMAVVRDCATETVCLGMLEAIDKLTDAEAMAECTRMWRESLPQDEVDALLRQLWFRVGFPGTEPGPFYSDKITAPGRSAPIHRDYPKEPEKYTDENQIGFPYPSGGLAYSLTLNRGARVGSERIPSEHSPRTSVYDYLTRSTSYLQDRLPYSRDLRDQGGLLDEDLGMGLLRSHSQAFTGTLIILPEASMHAFVAEPDRIACLGTHAIQLVCAE